MEEIKIVMRVKDIVVLEVLRVIKFEMLLVVIFLGFKEELMEDDEIKLF